MIMDMEETTKKKTGKAPGEGMTLAKRLERIERYIAIGTKEVLNTAELALYLGISESRLRSITSERSIPHYKNEYGRVCYVKSEIDRWRLGEKVKTKAELKQEAAAYCAKKRLERI